MRKRKKIILLLLTLLVLFALAVPRVQYLLGGAFINLGYRFQDHLHGMHPHSLIEEIVSGNKVASSVRKIFPRSTHHPQVAILVCMDARIDTAELVGDTRRLYYTVRTAGSILSPVEQDMLELAVANGVKALVLTTHTDCAAEKAASEPELRNRYPHLVHEVDGRRSRIQEFLQRPLIQAKIQSGELKVVQAEINTPDGEFRLLKE